MAQSENGRRKADRSRGSAHRSTGSAQSSHRTISTWRDGIIAAASLLVMIGANALIELLRLGGTTAAGVSRETFTWFAPAEYVFTIWTVIYIALAVWCAHLARTSTGNERFVGLPISRDAALFAVSCILNIVWLVLWHLRAMVPSVVVIIALLAVVSMLYLGTKRAGVALAAWIPLSLYTAWLLVAAIANIAHAITRSSSPGGDFIPAASTVLLLVVLLGVAFVMRRRFDDWVFALPIVWAGIGIGVRLMRVSAFVGVVVIALSVLGGVAVYVPWNRVSISRRSER